MFEIKDYDVYPSFSVITVNVHDTKANMCGIDAIYSDGFHVNCLEPPNNGAILSYIVFG